MEMASHKHFLSRINKTSNHFLTLIVQRGEYIRATHKKIKSFKSRLPKCALGDCFPYSLYRTSLQGVGDEVAVGVAVDVAVAVLVNVLVGVRVGVEVGVEVRVLVAVGSGGKPGRTIRGSTQSATSW